MELDRDQLETYLAKLLTPEIFEDYAPNGLQIEGKKTLRRIGFAVSATQESIRKALTWHADALIVHHGIFWKHHGPKPITGAWGNRIKLMIQNDMNLLAYHLPLDAHPEIGNAAALAKKLSMTNFRPFAMYKKSPLGIKADFKSKISAKELKQQLASILNHEVILASPDEEKMITNLGIVTGGANNEWTAALQDGLDAYLTGEISEYNWHDSIEAGIHYFAGGHHATEKFGIQALMEKIKSEFGVEVAFFDSPNPA
jgi:dinuclear metal center YbgI/SA1388 family protein